MLQTIVASAAICMPFTSDAHSRQDIFSVVEIVLQCSIQLASCTPWCKTIPSHADDFVDGIFE